ncbi:MULTISPECIES: hypothetical protein [unclassified Variovorax]|uniref:hypothetical protein n=1 Tax=unclassified Variovorax TaxID=663243 RepID=UPI0025756A12|nr:MULTISPECIES: hypothetical protein [unclassified Variovorax]MDM0088189.1 hypothetical protein [Variovorax sp. J22G40]MDM0146262.1 hypothetical protein [Variovorax sp. J2P1-31]
MKISLCTLFEGNYHFGVAALCNSLVTAGFSGVLWAGYRGALPAWLTGSPSYDAATATYQVSPDFQLRMVLLDTPVHFTYYKPTFVRDVFEKYAPDSDTVAYIDPDIVMKCDWPSFCGWFTDDALSLAEDVNWAFPSRHPKRLLWSAFFAQHGIASIRPIERYYNAGFIGVPRRHVDFLVLWERLCSLVLDYNQGVKHLKAGGSAALFHSTDQDALNFALTAHEATLNTAGPDAMDFTAGGYYLSHAIGSPKPWNTPHIRNAIGGQSPSVATKAYFQHIEGPIRAFSDAEIKRHRFALRLASAIGRVYQRR